MGAPSVVVTSGWRLAGQPRRRGGGGGPRLGALHSPMLAAMARKARGLGPARVLVPSGPSSSPGEPLPSADIGRRPALLRGAATDTGVWVSIWGGAERRGSMATA